MSIHEPTESVNEPTDHVMMIENSIDSSPLQVHYIEWNSCYGESSSLKLNHEKIYDHYIFMLHGSFQTCHTFDDFVEECKESFQNLKTPFNIRFIAMDLRGHGDTQHTPNQYVMKGFVSDLKQFVSKYFEKMDLSKDEFKISFIGMSLGGIILMNTFLTSLYTSPNDEFYVKFSNKLHNLSLIDISPDQIPVKQAEENSNKNATGTSHVTQQVQATLEFDTFEEFLNWAQKYNPRRSVENLRKRLQYSLKQNQITRKWTWKYDPTFSIDRIADENPQVNMRQELWENLRIYTAQASIPLSICIVKGAQSQVTTREQLEKLYQVLSNSSLHLCTLIEIDNAGHSVLGDNPKEFVQKYYVNQFELNY
ncbi:hypothetical protein C9374_003662 [Naegleria lovaniensis]|uniref:AB hydrolase-1 domain-containing protein n=1 Tax=Naegleria lovaniensis TaxID=51637 RepID=A0AA88H3L1_NAELO|nr:uncharacterized protein C9374_003662 [Naegleria lovaniensis]KAG2393898.1 hypothetical protein C9374_003662 [Naegleria lovaniensis]